MSRARTPSTKSPEHAIDREGQLVGKHLGQGLAPCLPELAPENGAADGAAAKAGLPPLNQRRFVQLGALEAYQHPSQERPANSASMRAWWGSSTGGQCLTRGLLQIGEQRLDPLAGVACGPVEGGEARRQLRPLAAPHGVIREPQADGVRPLKRAPVRPSQSPSRPGIRLKTSWPPRPVEAYGYLRHGEQTLLCHHPESGPGKEADAPPCRCRPPRRQGACRAVDVMIEPVLLQEEVAGIAEQFRVARLLLAVIKERMSPPAQNAFSPALAVNTQTMADPAPQRVNAPATTGSSQGSGR